MHLVWFKLDKDSRYEMFTPNPCDLPTAKAIARGLPFSTIVKLGENPNDESEEESSDYKN